MLFRSTSTGSGDITLAGTVNGAKTLAINTAGATVFSGVVGGSTPLTSITTDTPGTVAINTTAITTTGNQTYNENAATLGVSTTLNAGAGDINFAGTIDGAFSLDLNSTGTTTLGGAVGGTTALTSVTTNAGGTTAINGGAVTTTGNQAYNDAVSLGANTTLAAGAGNINLASTVDGAFSLDLNSTGTTTLGGAEIGRAHV